MTELMTVLHSTIILISTTGHFCSPEDIQGYKFQHTGCDTATRRKPQYSHGGLGSLPLYICTRYFVVLPGKEDPKDIKPESLGLSSIEVSTLPVDFFVFYQVFAVFYQVFFHIPVRYMCFYKRKEEDPKD